MIFNQDTTLFQHVCVQISSIGFLYYDYLLTFPMEVTYIWDSKFSYSTALYIGCRFGLIGNLLYLFTLFNILPNPQNFIYFISSLSIVGRACILVIWTLRTWALWQKATWILCLLVPWFAAIVTLDIVTAIPNVNTSENLDHALALLFLANEWTSATLSSLQWFMTWKDTRSLPLVRTKQNLAFDIFREGIFYICSISVFTLADVVLQFRAPAGSFYSHMFTAWTLPISGLLTARFILHMRTMDDHSLHTTEAQGETYVHSEDVRTMPVFAQGSTDSQASTDSME